MNTTIPTTVTNIVGKDKEAAVKAPAPKEAEIFLVILPQNKYFFGVGALILFKKLIYN